MIRILIVDNQSHFRTQVVAAWLHSFDTEINAIATDTIGNYALDNMAQRAMKEMHIDLTDANVMRFDEALTLNWDFIIVINDCIEQHDQRFVGNVMHWVNMNLQEFTNATLTEKEFYHFVCDKIRFETLTLFTKQIRPTDMIGLDNCGAQCDLL